MTIKDRFYCTGVDLKDMFFSWQAILKGKLLLCSKLTDEKVSFISLKAMMMSSLGNDTEVKFVPFTVSGNPPLQIKY